jgi:hypothetical protein
MVGWAWHGLIRWKSLLFSYASWRGRIARKRPDDHPGNCASRGFGGLLLTTLDIFCYWVPANPRREKVSRIS